MEVRRKLPLLGISTAALLGTIGMFLGTVNQDKINECSGDPNHPLVYLPQLSIGVTDEMCDKAWERNHDGDPLNDNLWDIESEPFRYVSEACLGGALAVGVATGLKWKKDGEDS